MQERCAGYHMEVTYIWKRRFIRKTEESSICPLRRAAFSSFSADTLPGKPETRTTPFLFFRSKSRQTVVTPRAISLSSAGRNWALYRKSSTPEASEALFSGHAPRKTGDEDYPFFADRTFVYYTGIEQADSVLAAYKDESGVQETL